MGYFVERFEGNVNPELICGVCKDVFDDPVQIPECQHIFCSACLEDWLDKSPTCPMDRKFIFPDVVDKGPNILYLMLNKLQIACDFQSQGCSAKIRIDELSRHTSTCKYKPKNEEANMRIQEKIKKDRCYTCQKDHSKILQHPKETDLLLWRIDYLPCQVTWEKLCEFIYRKGIHVIKCRSSYRDNDRGYYLTTSKTNIGSVIRNNFWPVRTHLLVFGSSEFEKALGLIPIDVWLERLQHSIANTNNP